jgi:hypothetical protein
MLEDAPVDGLLSLESGDGAGAHDGGLDAELVSEFGLPLLAEIRRAQDGDAIHEPTIEHLASDESTLDGLADPYIVRYEQSDCVQSEGHE